MALDVGDAMGPNAVVGSVLFVGSGPALAQDNADFFYDPATNTLKTKDQPNAATSNFVIGSGSVTAGNGSSGSGTVTINTGNGSPNNSGSGPAGNSGTVTVITGAGGASDNGSASGASGNLLFKTGSGGGNAFAGATGGNAGHIILQAGSGGSGLGGTGSGGSTILRASNSGDILSVQNSAGSTTHLAVSNSGNLRVGTSSSAARLHLGGGTTSLPPLKFDSGSLLSSPATGTLEWDGSEFYRTNATARRPLETSLEVANVLDFGAPANGTADDASAIQAAVSSLADLSTPGDGNGTGGIVYFPANKKYAIGSTIEIRCRSPIYLVSQMGWPESHADDTPNAQGYIKPLANLADGIFKWDSPGITAHAARGGAIGLTFRDDRDKLVHSCLNLTDFIHGVVQDCNFWRIKGRAVYCELASNWHAYRCRLATADIQTNRRGSLAMRAACASVTSSVASLSRLMTLMLSRYRVWGRAPSLTASPLRTVPSNKRFLSPLKRRRSSTVLVA